MKVCVVCGRPFQWRKKWKTVWAEVKYCSERCRGQRNRATPTTEKRWGAHSDGCYLGTTTHTANGLTVDWSIRSRVFQSALSPIQRRTDPTPNQPVWRTCGAVWRGDWRVGADGWRGLN